MFGGVAVGFKVFLGESGEAGRSAMICVEIELLSEVAGCLSNRLPCVGRKE